MGEIGDVIAVWVGFAGCNIGVGVWTAFWYWEFLFCMGLGWII